jgi:Tol biopolymer transport system component
VDERASWLEGYTSALKGWNSDSREVIYLATDSADPGATHRVVAQRWDGSGPARRVQVSEGGAQPVWDPNGHDLYYRSRFHVMRATIAREPELTVTRIDTLFRDVFVRGSATNSDVMSGRKELLMIREHHPPFRISVLVNWPELLRQRLLTR